MNQGIEDVRIQWTKVVLPPVFLEEIGPAIYNQAIADAQTRLTQRVADLSGELYSNEFQYWPRADAKRKSRR